MLDRLATADNISLRRGMFDRVAALGPGSRALSPRSERRQDPEQTPWYVLRNMLALMGALPLWPSRVRSVALPYRIDNAQVRFEALKLCMRIPNLRPGAVLDALRDDVGRIQVARRDRGGGGSPGRRPNRCCAMFALDANERGPGGPPAGDPRPGPAPHRRCSRGPDPDRGRAPQAARRQRDRGLPRETSGASDPRRRGGPAMARVRSARSSMNSRAASSRPDHPVDGGRSLQRPSPGGHAMTDAADFSDRPSAASSR